MGDATDFLTAYDEQLRGDQETPDALSVTHHGPLRLATFPGGHGFISYRDLGGAGPDELAALVEAARAHFEAQQEITAVEWKTRGHDHAPGLHEALLAHGFAPEEQESIMIGAARLLAVDVELPEGVTLHRVTEEADIRAMSAMQGEVFGDDPARSQAMADALVDTVADPGQSLWAARAGDVVVCAGRLRAFGDTEFAGVFGGATRPEWRGRGIYRALTAARARAAGEMGKRLIISDSTEYSRPILERSGLVKVSTTTPYRWRR